MENFILSFIINDFKEIFVMIDVFCFIFMNYFILKVFMVFVYVFVIGIFIIGNILLVFTYFKSKKMKIIINCCIMNMVFVDFFVILVYMLRMVVWIFISFEWLVEGILGFFFCVFVFLF